MYSGKLYCNYVSLGFLSLVWKANMCDSTVLKCKMKLMIFQAQTIIFMLQ